MQAPDHILIYVNNAEYAEQIPHPAGSGEIKWNSNTDLYSVQSAVGNESSQRDHLTEEEVPYALEELDIVDSSWV
jgi:hypothetical protein